MSRNYFRWMGVFLLGASIVSTSKQFFGDPIQVIFQTLLRLNSANGFVLGGVSPCTVFSSVTDPVNTSFGSRPGRIRDP
jgi:hypothetical protein